jgi:Ca-activated chloride channel family protein
MKPMLTNAVLMLFAVYFTVFSQIKFDASEIKGPVCVVMDSLNNNTFSLSPDYSQYNVVITDGFAHISLKQKFINPGFNIKSLVYVFPLPDAGSVNAMEMKYHNKIYKAVIYERTEAQHIYDSVTAKGQNAALLVQERPNIFQQSIANIAPGDSAFITIKISMPLKYNNRIYELSIPTMIGARYQSSGTAPVPSSGLWNPPENRDGSTIQINLLLQTGFPVEEIVSPTHTLEVKEFSVCRDLLIQRDVLSDSIKTNSNYAKGIVLAQANSYPNRDFVLRFNRTAKNQDFNVVSQLDTTYQKGHFALTLFPNDSSQDTTRYPLEIVLLIDVSGSQSGWPLQKEKEIALEILNRLKPFDKISILAFSDQVYWAFNKVTPSSATSDTLKLAADYIKGLNPLGGTQLLNGVQSALSVPKNTEYQRYFIFLTDGFVTNETEIFDAIKNHPSNPTIFTFGAGNSLNRYFLETSATVGNGYATEVTELEDAASMVEPAWEKISSPQLDKISVSFSNETVGDIIVPESKTLYSGDAFNIYGTYVKGGSTIVTLKGYRDGKVVEITKTIDFATSLNANFMLPQIWAKKKIDYLSIEQGTTDSKKDSIILISEKYQVLSKYTAFLAVAPVDEKSPNEINEKRKHVDLVRKDIRFVCNNRSLVITLPEKEYITEIIIFDITGKVIFRYNPGSINNRYIWNGLLKNGRGLISGRYIVRVKTSSGKIISHTFLWSTR